MKESIPYVNSIFEQPWWLEAVAPGQWGAAEIEKDGRLIARLPYVRQKRFGMKILGMPDYTQTLGYWVDDTGAKNARKFSRNKDLISELIGKLPKGYSADLALDHSCDYLLPFKWNGYRLELAYTYRLEDINDTTVIWNGLAANIKTDIKKAQKILTIEEDHPIEDLIALQNKSFNRHGRPDRDDGEVLRRLDSVLKEKEARKLLCAVDDEGRIHAASYFVYDSHCCYYLVGGGDPELRSSGASSLLVWEGIQFASTVSGSFDFEGSMIEPIERFFRAFGGTPTPYWRVTKMNLLLSIMDYLKPKVKKLLGWR